MATFLSSRALLMTCSIFAVSEGFSPAIGSSNNVYIPVGTWFILVGVLGIHEFGKRREGLERLGASSLLLFVSFALLLYNPLNEICSFRASESYDDLVAELNGVDGTVYAPSLGQLQEGYVLYPAAHWVALEDMLRGPGKETRDHPTVRRLLQPVIEPNGPTYILSNYPLDDLIPALAFLTDYYVLAEDYEDRFKPLRVLPGRWDHAWPRYLYRYDAAKAVADE